MKESPVQEWARGHLAGPEEPEIAQVSRAGQVLLWARL